MKLEGVFSVLPTPFLEDGAVDHGQHVIDVFRDSLASTRIG